LIEVVDRLKEAYDISYHIYLVRLFKLPVDLQEAKKNIKEYIDKETAMNLKKKSASDIKLKLNISF
jgi:hypothetical protein